MRHQSAKEVPFGGLNNEQEMFYTVTNLITPSPHALFSPIFYHPKHEVESDDPLKAFEILQVAILYLVQPEVANAETKPYLEPNVKWIG